MPQKKNTIKCESKAFGALIWSLSAVTQKKHLDVHYIFSHRFHAKAAQVVDQKLS